MPDSLTAAPPLSANIAAIRAYLLGGSKDELHKAMNLYDGDEAAFNRDYFGTPIAAIHGIKELLIQLGITTNYDESQLSLFQLLRELNKRKCVQLIYLINLIEHKNKINKLLLVGGIGIFASSCLLIASPAGFVAMFVGIKNLIDIVCISPIGLPIVGFIYTGGLLVYTAYNLFTNKTINTEDKIREMISVLIYSLISVAAYSAWLVAGSVMTPLVVILFSLASVVDVVKEVIALIQELVNYSLYPPVYPVVQDSHDEIAAIIVMNAMQQTSFRHDLSLIMHRRAILINLTAAVILMVIMTAWCFVPSTLLVTISFLAALTAVYAIKYLALHLNSNKIQSTLQETLAASQDVCDRRLEETLTKNLKEDAKKKITKIDNFGGLMEKGSRKSAPIQLGNNRFSIHYVNGEALISSVADEEPSMGTGYLSNQ